MIIRDIEKKSWETHLATRQEKQAVFVFNFSSSCHFRLKTVREQTKPKTFLRKLRNLGAARMFQSEES